MNSRESTKSLGLSADSEFPHGIVNFRDEWCLNVPDPRGPSILAKNSGKLVQRENLLEKIINDKQCEDFNSCWNRHGAEIVSTCFRIGVGIIFAIITLIVYFWMAPCACCRCCRKSPMWCCARERRKLPGGISRRAKLFLFSSSAIYMVWYIVDTSLLAHKIPSLSSNVKGLVCEASNVLVDTLRGEQPVNKDSNAFIGMYGMESAVGSIREYLEPEGEVLKVLSTGITSSSSDFKASVEDLLSELQVLHENLALEANRNIGPYECVFCFVWCTQEGNTGPAVTSQGISGTSAVFDPSKSRLTNAIERIRTELADGLNEVDRSIEENLTGESIEEIRGALENGSNSIREFSREFNRNFVEPFIKTGNSLNTIIKYLDLAAVVVVSLMVVPTVLFIISLIWVFWKRRGTTSTRPLLNSSDRLPVPRKPWLVSTSWCITFLFAFVVFLLSGVASILANLESSACQAVTRPKDLVAKIASRFSNADGGDMLMKFTSECVAHGKKSRNFAQVINFKMNRIDEDESSTDYDDEPNQIRRLENRIYRDLDNMETKVGEKHEKISTNKDIVSFLQQLYDYGDIFLHTDSFSNPALISNPRFWPAIRVALTSIASCDGKANLHLSGPFGRFIRHRFATIGYQIPEDVSQFSLPGANEYYQELERAGIDIGVTSAFETCPRKFLNLRPAVVGTAEGAFQELMVEKMAVVTKDDFVCNQRGPKGIEERTCNFDEWRQYLRRTHSLLVEMVEKIDEAQAEFHDEVVTSVRKAFEGSVIPEMESLADGMDCSYIHKHYEGMLRNLCEYHAPAMYTTAMGWLMFGLMCWIAIMVEFWLWRYLKDYWTIVSDDDSGDFHTPPENPLDNTLIMSGGETPPLRETRAVTGRRQSSQVTLL